jgi:hypothetical protein
LRTASSANGEEEQLTVSNVYLFVRGELSQTGSNVFLLVPGELSQTAKVQTHRKMSK